MRHFMAQFGPALQWPWTKLMDVPALDDALLDRIVAQSDAQAGTASIRELERLRDACLVAVTQALKTHGIGAGEVLAAYERDLWHARGREAEATAVQAAPLDIFRGRVEPGWIDYNGHMNESRYLQAFSQAGDVLLGMIGADADYVARGHSFYTAETHIRHLREMPPDAPFRVTLQVLGADGKRLHFWQEMYRVGEDAPVATCEQMALHVNAATGRACPALPEIRARLDPIVAAHAALPRPEGAGRAIRMPGRP